MLLVTVKQVCNMPLSSRAHPNANQEKKKREEISSDIGSKHN